MQKQTKKKTKKEEERFQISKLYWLFSGDIVAVEGLRKQENQPINKAIANQFISNNSNNKKALTNEEIEMNNDQ